MPAANEDAIGHAIADNLAARQGPDCQSDEGNRALRAMGEAIFGEGGPEIRVLRDFPARAVALPGDLLVVDQGLFADGADRTVIAGALQAARANPMTLQAILADTSVSSVGALLTTGELPEQSIDDAADAARAKTPATVAPKPLDLSRENWAALSQICPAPE